MKISDAIEKINEIKKDNGYKDAQIIEWLSTLDGIVYDDIISTHLDGVESFTPYTAVTPTNTVLLIPEPYSEVYIYYLKAMIDDSNSETTRYANDMQMFNSMYEKYENNYNSKHLPAVKYYIKMP